MTRKDILNTKFVAAALAVFLCFSLFSLLAIYYSIWVHSEQDLEEIRKDKLSSVTQSLRDRVNLIHSSFAYEYSRHFNVSRLTASYGSYLEQVQVALAVAPSDFVLHTIVSSDSFPGRNSKAPLLFWRCEGDNLTDVELLSNGKHSVVVGDEFLRSQLEQSPDICLDSQMSPVVNVFDFRSNSGQLERIPVLMSKRSFPKTAAVSGFNGVGLVLTELKRDVQSHMFQYAKDVSASLGDGYIWVADVDKPFPRILMHPIIEKLAGHVMRSPFYKAASDKGDRIVISAINLVKSQGEGVISYDWPRSGQDLSANGARKLSYVKLFDPFGWIIGSGSYLDTIDQAIAEKIARMHQTTKQLLKWLLLLVGLLVVIAFLVVVRTIEERKVRRVAQELLHVSQERLEVATRGADVALWDLDFASGELFCDARWCRFVGLLTEEFRGSIEVFLKYVHPEDRLDAETIFSVDDKGLLRQGEVSYRILSGSGLWCWIRSRGQVVEREEAGVPLRAAGTHVDITEQKSSEEERAKLKEGLDELRRVESLGRLAGGVAHDLNNMLSPVIGYSDLLLMNCSVDDPGYNELRAISDAAYRAKNLTSQLLAVGRRQLLSIQALDIKALFERFERLLQPLLREDIQLNMFFAEDLGNVKADPFHLEQIFLNLVINAQDAMPSGGTLTIEMRNQLLSEEIAQRHSVVVPGEYISFAVRDTGIGMDESTRQRIFEPFFTTKEIGTGTGLGLASVLGIVQQHGGAIEVNTVVGVGSEFVVFLPRFDVDTSCCEDMEVMETSTISYGGSETIMVVEDDQLVCELASKVLSQHGYNVIAIESPKVAIAMVVDSKTHGHEPDLLLTDVLMPGMDGQQLYEELHKICPSLRVLYMSGYSGELISKRGLLEHGVELLRKPFTVVDLTAMVGKVLGKEPE